MKRQLPRKREQDVVVNRWKPQGAEASPQLRKAPFKRPPPIITEPSKRKMPSIKVNRQLKRLHVPAALPTVGIHKETPLRQKQDLREVLSNQHVNTRSPVFLIDIIPSAAEQLLEHKNFLRLPLKCYKRNLGIQVCHQLLPIYPSRNASVLDRYKPKANHSEQNTVTDPPSFRGFPVSTKGVLESTGEESDVMRYM